MYLLEIDARKNLWHLKWKWQKKFKRSINEKLPNPVEITEENGKIIGPLNFLAPRDALKKSSTIGEKPPNPKGKLRKKTYALIDKKPLKLNGKPGEKNRRKFGP